MSDPSVSFDAGKERETFRVYEGEFDRKDTVLNHYTAMRSNQTVAFSQRMKAKWLKFDKAELTVREAFRLLEGYVDSSDPDTELPNLEHMMQTAEAIRKAGHPDWFQLVGLLHDMGKIMFEWGEASDGQQGTAEGPQWALGGDTWVVGCRIPDCATMPELNVLNPDMHDPRYNTECGMYEEGCGLDSLEFAFGHDDDDDSETSARYIPGLVLPSTLDDDELAEALAEEEEEEEEDTEMEEEEEEFEMEDEDEE